MLLLIIILENFLLLVKLFSFFSKVQILEPKLLFFFLSNNDLVFEVLLEFLFFLNCIYFILVQFLFKLSVIFIEDLAPHTVCFHIQHIRSCFFYWTRVKLGCASCLHFVSDFLIFDSLHADEPGILIRLRKLESLLFCFFDKSLENLALLSVWVVSVFRNFLFCLLGFFCPMHNYVRLISRMEIELG